MPSKSVKSRGTESIIRLHNLEHHIMLIRKSLSSSQNKNLKESEVRCLLQNIYCRKTKFKTGVKEMRHSHMKFVKTVINTYLFGRMRHKKYWKNLKKFNPNELGNYDHRSNSVENSDRGILNNKTGIRNDDSSDQTVKSKRTVKTMCGGQESDNLSDRISEVNGGNGGAIKVNKETKKTRFDTNEIKKKVKIEVKEEEKRKDDDMRRSDKIKLQKAILKLIEQSNEQVVTIAINKNDLTLNKLDNHPKIEEKEKYKCLCCKGKKHKCKNEWSTSKVRSNEQRDMVKKELSSPLDPFCQDIYDNLIPQKLKNKLKTVNIAIPENKWAKEFAWMGSSNINQFKIFSMMEDEINRHLDFLNKNPDEPKFSSKEELYLKDLVVFISTKIEGCFPSIIARSPNVKCSEKHLEIYNKRCKMNIKYMHINFIWVMRLLLKRSREASRLEFAYSLISVKHCTVKDDWIVLNEEFVKQLFVDFTSKLLTKLRIAQILVVFFMFYPSTYDATLILSNYDEWCEISKQQKYILESHEDSNLTLDTVKVNKRKNEKQSKQSKHSQMVMRKRKNENTESYRKSSRRFKQTE